VIYQVLRLFQPEVPAPDTAVGDSLAQPLAASPDPRGSTVRP
jgi:hypothetical protein